jgi:hypothetical protein
MLNMKKNVINQIKELLGMEVKLATMKLSDGMTILEAEVFEAGAEVFIVAEDQKIALPVGEYELEDSRILVVIEEGLIAEIKDAVAEEEEPMEEPEVEIEVEAEAAAPKEIKKTVESIVKETFFSEMEALKLENEELKAKLEMFSKVDTTTEVATEETTEEIKIELEEVTPITFNPENKTPIEVIKFGQKRGMSTMDRILDKLSK